MLRKSKLQHNPKSKIIEKGYINVYSKVNSKVKRQLMFKQQYKKDNPKWDETLVYLAKKLNSLNGNELVVLDAGCGNGNYIIDENRSKIRWAAGLDVRKEFVKNNICLDEIAIGNLENLPFEKNFYDIVLSLWVLEHLKDPQNAIKEIARVLKPGGLFMFATPNKDYFPLKIVHLLKNTGINSILNKILFGRSKTDIFPAYYKANTLKDINILVKDYFEIEELKLNYDVSYLAFNKITYNVAKELAQTPNYMHRYFYPHVIGIAKKIID